MKQEFASASSSSLPTRVQQAVRRGGVQLLAGSALLVGLVLAGLGAVLFTEPLNEGSVSDAYRPPHHPIAQRLLYRPPLQVERIQEKKNSDPFQLGAMLPSSAVSLEPTIGGSTIRSRRDQVEGSSAMTITSRPWYTAVVGQPYRYTVEVSPAETDATFRLKAGPSGMTVSSTGHVEWTPRASQDGMHTITVAARSLDARGVQQTYRLHVSEQAYPLGTEQRGRSLGAALVLGARWAVLPGFLAVAISMILGVIAGGLAGYYEGASRTALTYASSLTEALPALVVLFIAAVAVQYNIYLIMVIVGVIWFPRVANAIKAKVESLKARQFVEASRELGLRDREILWRDIIWHNAWPQLLLQASYGFAFAIIVEVTLSYLRLGIQVPTVSWGNLLYEGRGQLVNHLYGPVVLPAVAIVISVGAFYLLADGIRRRYSTTHA